MNGLFVYPVVGCLVVWLVGWLVSWLITSTTLLLPSMAFVTDLNELYVGLVNYEVWGNFIRVSNKIN